MSRKSAYKQVLSIGTAVVLGFALFTGSIDGAPKLLSPQSDEQAVALAEKQNESPSRTDDEADLVARLESGTPTSTAPAVFISAAFPTTPATPTLPFAPTARTRSARRHSHSMNTIAPPKRAALRNSPSSIA